MRHLRQTRALIAALPLALAAGGARALDDGLPELPVIGAPVAGGTGFHTPVTELARDIVWLDGTLMVILTLVTLLVVGLLGWVIWRYNARANPVPATFTHHSRLEVTWTVVPILILVFIGAFSLPILFKQQTIPDADVTIKVTGYQWHWGYEYPDHGFDYLSFMLDRDQLTEHGYEDQHYLLATDTAMVVPVNANVVVQVTAADVIHSWTIPSFGVKQDGIPGRLAELWFRAEQEGVYFGQCSELCGVNHAYMPITVKVVSEAEYEAWLDRAIDAYGGTPREQDLAAAR
ncbi:cytochrome c oxidase subunit II [Rhodobaculum claviforme]|uniref:Cytochrome c oxidase subunit 2 n=1 Tax=Rhodobaculum claviforme TaxID=1549854 RepID=A0A934WHT8_9RHOB|nr:cytochrome c oxidase subunit II [Rhodobaculum claviforme]MBK5927480.1 cytochrome c oxidase subunit II [Rhodobaculum claviforme]